LTLFNNADSSGSSNQADSSYSELLSGIDALGNKLDQTQKYKLVTPGGTVLVLSARHVSLERDSVATTSREQWIIRSTGDGFFQVGSVAAQDAPLVLDGSDIDHTVAAPPDSNPAQQWDMRSAGNGMFQFVNRVSGRPVSLEGRGLSFHVTPTL
jgi:hypothetical protein